jgi:hypothetical protein
VRIRKKKSADADEKNKKVKENAENGFFPKKLRKRIKLKAKKNWQIRKIKKKADYKKKFYGKQKKIYDF